MECAWHIMGMGQYVYGMHMDMCMTLYGTVCIWYCIGMVRYGHGMTWNSSCIESHGYAQYRYGAVQFGMVQYASGTVWVLWVWYHMGMV